MNKKTYEPIMISIKISQLAMSLIQEIEQQTLPLFEHWVNPKNEEFGTFNPIRIVTPLIESSSHIEYKGDPKKILEILKVPEPKISWFMFRHGLSHSIRPYIVEWEDKKYNWGIQLFKGAHHMKEDKTIILSAIQLVEDLKSYLEKFKYDDKNIMIQTGVRILS